MKSKPIISLLQTMKIQLLDFHCLGLLFSPLFYEFSAKKLAQIYLSEITATTLTFHDRTADVTYCADVTLFLHVTSGGLSLTAAFFCGDFLRFIALNAIWAHFLGAKLRFHPTFYPQTR